MKSKSLQKNLIMLMRNKIVLYVLLGLAVVNLFGYLMQHNLVAIGLFLVVGYGMTLATKNMAIVLLVAILVTNFVIRRGLLNNIGILEGLNEDQQEEEPEENPEEEEHPNSPSGLPEGLTEDKMKAMVASYLKK